MTEHSVGSGRNNTGYAKKADSDQWSQQVLIPAANQNLQLYVQLSPLLKRPVWRRPLCKNLATFRNSKTNRTWRDSLTTFTSSFMKFCLILATSQKRPVMFYHGLVTSAQTYERGAYKTAWNALNLVSLVLGTTTQNSLKKFHSQLRNIAQI